MRVQQVLDLLRGLVEVGIGLQALGLQELRADVRSHDDDRVPEIHHAAFAVGQAAIIHDLQQDVEHIRMRLLDLVEQDDRVRAATHLLGKLSAFFVADVSRRRADQARDRVLLHVLGHVDADHGVLVVEQKLGECTRQFGLADAGRAQENERADRTLGIAQSCARTPNRIGHALQRRVLSHHALPQPLFHVDQLLDFAFEHLRDGNAGPLGDDARDIFFVDFFLQHALAGFAIHVGCELTQFGLEAAVSRRSGFPSHALQIAFALFGLLFDFELLDFLLELARCARSDPSPFSSSLSARWTSREFRRVPFR